MLGNIPPTDRQKAQRTQLHVLTLCVCGTTFLMMLMAEEAFDPSAQRIGYEIVLLLVLIGSHFTNTNARLGASKILITLERSMFCLMTLGVIVGLAAMVWFYGHFRF